MAVSDRDWSNFSTSLLIVAFQRLEIPGLLRSSAVCRSWRSAVDELRRLRLPSPFQSPWILTWAKRRADPFTADFYSLSEAKTYTISLPYPPIRHRFCIGCSHGWFITADNESELHLLNPITGAQIDLPRVSTFPHIKTTFHLNCEIKMYEIYNLGPNSGQFLGTYYPKELRRVLYDRASLWSEGSNYIVMVIHSPYSNLSFARAGDQKWTTIPRKTHLEGFYPAYRHCLYYKGLLLAVNIRGIVEAWDISGVFPEEKYVIPQPEGLLERQIFYFVQTPWGDLLQVWRVRETANVKMYKMDFDGRRYIEVSSLGDHVLFLGYNDALCLSSKDFPMLRANCIYFLEDPWTKISNDRNAGYDISIYNMEDGSSEQILPNDPQPTWPPPIWMTPTLT